jgi:ketosteroid isomerase-like protein
MDATALARAYYRAIDAGADDDLAEVLSADFVHERPDRTIEGREAFVQFMREQRPDPNTDHEVEAIYDGATGVAVQGRVRRADGTPWFEFVDVFSTAAGTLTRLRTYTR